MITWGNYGWVPPIDLNLVGMSSSGKVWVRTKFVVGSRAAIGIRPPKLVGVTRNRDLGAPFPLSLCFKFLLAFITCFRPSTLEWMMCIVWKKKASQSCDNVETSRHDSLRSLAPFVWLMAKNLKTLSYYTYLYGLGKLITLIKDWRFIHCM